jgi:hypothetical protein
MDVLGFLISKAENEGLPQPLSDGNKSLYLVFVGVVFSQHLGLLLEQLE